MAIYHLSVKPVQRSKGRSSVAAAAYRSGSELHDERTGLTHDYTRKSGVLHTELIGWAGSRESLWSAAELAERRRDATTSREYEIALPDELSRDAQFALAAEFGQWLNERHGVAVDVCVHQGHGDERNVHAHIMTSTRASDGHNLGEKVAREWSDKRRKERGLAGRKADLEEARARWAELANEALKKTGSCESIDHRSYAARGIDAIPQPKFGAAALALERRGEQTDRGAQLRNVVSLNEARARLRPEREFDRVAARLEQRERDLKKLYPRPRNAEREAREERAWLIRKYAPQLPEAARHFHEADGAAVLAEAQRDTAVMHDGRQGWARRWLTPQGWRTHRTALSASRSAVELRSLADGARSALDAQRAILRPYAGTITRQVGKVRREVQDYERRRTAVAAAIAQDRARLQRLDRYMQEKAQQPEPKPAPGPTGPRQGDWEYPLHSMN